MDSWVWEKVLVWKGDVEEICWWKGDWVYERCLREEGVNRFWKGGFF